MTFALGFVIGVLAVPVVLMTMLLIEDARSSRDLDAIAAVFAQRRKARTVETSEDWAVRHG